jgi:DNA-binding transcriptional MerR regulator
MYTIGKVATQMGVSTDTLRYYEKEGLITPTSKTAAGYRLYNDNALQRIRFIKHAQQCGFTLSNINDLLMLKHENKACCNDVRSVAIEKKLYLEHKIKALQLMSEALSDLIAICDDETRPLVECPILAALESSLDRYLEGARP